MRAWVLLAEGVEEMEAVIVMDILRRGGWEVSGAGLKPGPVTGSRRVCLIPDATLDQVRPGAYDALIIPGGGPGVKHLCENPAVLEVIRQFDRAHRLIGAVCAGPLVLHAAGILKGRQVTCFPGCAPDPSDAVWRTDRVVTDGHIVTSQGPGTCFEFALTLLRIGSGQETARRVAEGLVLPPGVGPA